jgi:uncharacterized protein (DUF305 family)
LLSVSQNQSLVFRENLEAWLGASTTMLRMTLPHIRSITVPLVAVLALAACSRATQEPVRTSPPPSRDQSDIAAIAKAKADSARYPYTAADVHFMSGMIGHHAQAIDIARWAPTHGASASLQTLAERVINAQQDEIALMQRWLRDRQQPVPEARATAMKTNMGGVEHAHLMPGMISEDQLKQLDQARGKDFDRLFLTFMIQHHRGAVTMVEELFRSQGAGLDDTVFKVASDISADQSAEIDRMQRMLFTVTTGIPSP